jgi:hypothetical protein
LRIFHSDIAATGKYESQKNVAIAKRILSNMRTVEFLSFNNKRILESIYIDILEQINI